MTRQEFISNVNELCDFDFEDEIDDQVLFDEIVEQIYHYKETILSLQKQLESSSNSRKSQVLEILKENKSVSIIDIAKKLNISTKNVSSQLTYLRADGYKIFTDHKGRKVLNQED